MTSWHAKHWTALLALCGRKPLVNSGFLHKGPVTWSFASFFVVKPGQGVKQTVALPAIWDALTPTWRHWNGTTDHTFTLRHRCSFFQWVYRDISSKLPAYLWYSPANHTQHTYKCVTLPFFFSSGIPSRWLSRPLELDSWSPWLVSASPTTSQWQLLDSSDGCKPRISPIIMTALHWHFSFQWHSLPMTSKANGAGLLVTLVSVSMASDLPVAVARFRFWNLSLIKIFSKNSLTTLLFN